MAILETEMTILETELKPEDEPAELSARKPAALMDLDLSLIRPSALNPRDLFEATALDSLAESIRAHGVRVPISVRLHVLPSAEGETGYEIIAGERRFRAAQMAGLATIPALVEEVGSDGDALVLTLIENLQREQLNDIEKARGYSQLIDMNYTQAQIAALCGGSVPDVSNTVRLLKLPLDVQDYISTKQLTASHGELLLPVLNFPVGPDTGKAYQVRRVIDMADIAVQQGQTVKALKAKIDALKADLEERYPKPAPPPTLLDVPPDAASVARSSAPEEQSRFAPPGPVPAGQVLPLTPGGDDGMTDEEWEQSANPPALKQDAADALAALSTERDEAVKEWGMEGGDAPSAEDSGDTPGTNGPALDKTALDTAVSAIDAVSTPEAPSAQPSPATAASAPAPVTTKPAPPRTPATAPVPAAAPPALPEGWTQAMVKVEDFAKAQEMGLWPLDFAIKTVNDLEAHIRAVDAQAANLVPSEPQEDAPSSIAMVLAGSAATRLADINSTAGSVLYPAETQLLDELFPTREATGADHIVAVLVTARMREMTVKSDNADS